MWHHTYNESVDRAVAPQFSILSGLTSRPRFSRRETVTKFIALRLSMLNSFHTASSTSVTVSVHGLRDAVTI